MALNWIFIIAKSITREDPKPIVTCVKIDFECPKLRYYIACMLRRLCNRWVIPTNKTHKWCGIKTIFKHIQTWSKQV